MNADELIKHVTLLEADILAARRLLDELKRYVKFPLRAVQALTDSRWRLKGALRHMKRITDPDPYYCPRCDTGRGPEDMESGGGCRFCHEPMEEVA